MSLSKVCEECKCSVLTFFRKVRGEEELLSNAEQGKFKSIKKEIIRDMMRQASIHCG